MPAIGNIVINDAAATPVAHTFSPSGIEGPLAKFDDRSGGISVGFPRITISSIAPTRTSRLYKARFKIVLPVLENTSGSSSNGFTPAPTKAYDLTADMTFILPERSTLQNRKDIFAFAKNLLSNATAVAVVENNEVVY